MPKPFQNLSDFPPTRWTLVQRAVAQGDAGAFAALSSLCEIYYSPLLAVIRSQGYSPEDADDLRQRYFIHIVEREKFVKALSVGVKLRAFLLQELKGFLIDQYRHSIAAKRDTRNNDSLIENKHSGLNPRLQDWRTPDLEYDRAWRRALITESMRALGGLWEQKRLVGQKLLPFLELGPLLSYSTEESQRDVAVRLGINQNTLKSQLREARAELGKQIHFHVAQTLLNPTKEAVKAEILELRLMK